MEKVTWVVLAYLLSYMGMRVLPKTIFGYILKFEIRLRHHLHSFERRDRSTSGCDHCLRPLRGFLVGWWVGKDSQSAHSFSGDSGHWGLWLVFHDYGHWS